MKRYIALLLIVFFSVTFLSIDYACAEDKKKEKKTKKTYTEREYVAETKDGQLIHGYLTYPKTNLKNYPTIILLHSIGRSSNYWYPLYEDFNNIGYAVLRIDFRGHGKSVYNNKFKQQSWTTFKNKTFEKYPQDVLDLIEKIQKETKKADFANYAIIGSDIGANTAVIVARNMQVKPNGLVLISPRLNNKGLYIPILLTEIGNTPILAISSKTNNFYMQEQERISKFAQGDFDVYNTEKGGADMTIIKQQPETKQVIIDWVQKVFNK